MANHNTIGGLSIGSVRYRLLGRRTHLTPIANALPGAPSNGNGTSVDKTGERKKISSSIPDNGTGPLFETKMGSDGLEMIRRVAAPNQSPEVEARWALMSETDWAQLEQLSKDYERGTIDDQTLGTEVEKILGRVGGENGTWKAKKWLPDNSTDSEYPSDAQIIERPPKEPNPDGALAANNDAPYKIDSLVWRGKGLGPAGDTAVAPLIWRNNGSNPGGNPAVTPLIWTEVNEPSPAAKNITPAVDHPPLNWGTQTVSAQSTPPANNATSSENQTLLGKGSQQAPAQNIPPANKDASNVSPPQDYFRLANGSVKAGNTGKKKKKSERNSVKANAQEDRSSNVGAPPGKTDIQGKQERKSRRK